MNKMFILAVFTISTVSCVYPKKSINEPSTYTATIVSDDTKLTGVGQRVKVPSMTATEQEEMQDQLDQREGTAMEKKIAVDGMFQCRTDWICTEGLTSFTCSCNATGVYKP